MSEVKVFGLKVTIQQMKIIKTDPEAKKMAEVIQELVDLLFDPLPYTFSYDNSIARWLAAEYDGQVIELDPEQDNEGLNMGGKKGLEPDLAAALKKTLKGGAGSGNFEHRGRPGKVGGSMAKNEAATIEDQNRLARIGYAEFSSYSMSGTEEGDTWVGPKMGVILPDGTTLTGVSQRHTQLYAGYVLAHPEKFKDKRFWNDEYGQFSTATVIEGARQILDEGRDESEPMESEVMKDTGAISFEMDYHGGRSWEPVTIISVKCLESFIGREDLTAPIIMRAIDRIKSLYLSDKLPSAKYFKIRLYRSLPYLELDLIDQITHVDLLGDWAAEPAFKERLKGGPGSGFRGHAGRPGEVGGSQPKYEFHADWDAVMPAPSRSIEDPDFKRWFAGSKVVGKGGKPLVVYHGTTPKEDFSQFEFRADSPANDTTLGWESFDRLVGPHFAVDAGIASRFGMGLYGAANQEIIPENAQVKPVFLAIKKPFIIQPIKNRFDQSLIVQHMADVVFSEPENRNTFADWFSTRTNSDWDRSLAVWDSIKAGKNPGPEIAGSGWSMSPEYIKSATGKRKVSFGAMVGNLDAGLTFIRGAQKGWFVREYKRIMARKGYDGIAYYNTAPMEIGKTHLTIEPSPSIWQSAKRLLAPPVHKRLCYIPFHPEQIKSALGNVGEYSPASPDITKEIGPRLARDLKKSLGKEAPPPKKP